MMRTPRLDYFLFSSIFLLVHLWGVFKKFVSGVQACSAGNVFKSDACFDGMPDPKNCSFSFNDHRDPDFRFA